VKNIGFPSATHSSSTSKYEYPWSKFVTSGPTFQGTQLPPSTHVEGASMWLDKIIRTPKTLHSITTPKTLVWTVKNWIQETILSPTKETFLPISVKRITIASIKRQPEPFSVRSTLPRSASFFGKPFISDQLQPMWILGSQGLRKYLFYDDVEGYNFDF
jgi:hypothetical protein